MKKTNILMFSFCLASALVLTDSVSAYFTVTASIYAEPVVVGNSTVVNVSIVNSGNELAYGSILGFASSEKFNSTDFNLGVLEPNKTNIIPLLININADAPLGRYPLVLILRYTDANRYPFSMVFPSMISLKEDSVPMVHGVMSPIELATDEQKTLALDVRNLDAKQHKVHVRLFLPDELNSDPLEREVEIPPKSIRKINFTVSSLGALPDSSYTIAASLGYDEGGKYYSSITNGLIKVVKNMGAEPPRTVESAEDNKTFFVLVGSLVILFVLLLHALRKHKK